MIAALERKGLQREERDHVVLRLYVNGRRAGIWTKFSRGASEYGDALLNAVRWQLKLDRTSFDARMDCPMDGAAYARHLADRGHLDEPRTAGG